MTDTKFIKQVKDAYIKITIRNALLHNGLVKGKEITEEEASKFAQIQLKQMPLPVLLEKQAAFLFTYKLTNEEKKKYKKEVRILREALQNLDRYGRFER